MIIVPPQYVEKQEFTCLSNRLSEQNIATILGNIEALYREHRRHGEGLYEFLSYFAQFLC